MAFILKSSRQFPSFAGYSQLTRLSRLKTKMPKLLWEQSISINKSLARQYSMPSVQTVNAESLAKSIYQLHIDANYKVSISGEKIEEVLASVKSIGEIQLAQSILLLKCCHRLPVDEIPQLKIEIVEKMWSLFEELGVMFTPVHYNEKLKIYLDNRHKFSPLKVLNELKERNIEPNPLTYFRLLRASCGQGDITTATILLEEMKARNLPINEDVLNSLILAHCLLNDLESAMATLNIMEQKRLDPNSETYLHFLCYWARVGNIEKIREIIQECTEKEIVLLDKDLLEIIYTLAVHNHETHIDEILVQLTKNFEYVKEAGKVIHRLLLNNYDSVVFKILETVTVKDDKIWLKRGIVKHFFKYRSIDELFDSTERLKNTELTSAIYYNLKPIFENDPQKSCDILLAMRNKNFKFEEHLCWPIIVTAGKKGKDELYDILFKMKNVDPSLISKLPVQNLLLPNLNIDENWIQDLNKLVEVGFSKSKVCFHLCSKFLRENKLQETEKLVRKHGIIKAEKLTGLLVQSLLVTKDSQSFVSIIFSLLHDISILEEDKGNKNYKPLVSEDFIAAILKLLVNKSDEATLKSVLEEMLSLKIGVSPITAGLIQKQFDCSEISSLLEKLTSSDLKCELNPEIMMAKKGKTKIISRLLNEAFESDDENFEKTLMEARDTMTIKEMLFALSVLAKKNDMNKAKRICRTLKFKTKGKNAPKLESAFFKFLNWLLKNENVESAEKFFDIGVKNNIIRKQKYRIFIWMLLRRNQVNEAVKVFCKMFEDSKYLSAQNILIKRLIESKDVQGLQKVLDSLTKCKGEAAGLNICIFNFAALGHVKQTRRLLELRRCNVLSPNDERYFSPDELKNPTLWETLITASEGISDVDRVYLYEKLLKLYIESDQHQKIGSLWTRVQEENLWGTSNLEKMLTKYFKSTTDPKTSEIKGDEKILGIQEKYNR